MSQSSGLKARGVKEMERIGNKIRKRIEGYYNDKIREQVVFSPSLLSLPYPLLLLPLISFMLAPLLCSGTRTPNA